MDINDIMRMAGQLRDQLTVAQKEVGNIRVKGEAGAGLVSVVMNGNYEAVEVHIDKKAMVASEVSLLEDLVRAAINSAASKIADSLRERVGDLGKNMGIDISQFTGGDKPNSSGG
ncbi:MAG: YbaB/EbfC family nucleoid-associated protein [Deltaproteobacteria bacterium]|nr:YbaB/EbfC family nucleoid-associated protein [Deltaproteobacteria bacterium]